MKYGNLQFFECERKESKKTLFRLFQWKDNEFGFEHFTFKTSVKLLSNSCPDLNVSFSVRAFLIIVSEIAFLLILHTHAYILIPFFIIPVNTFTYMFYLIIVIIFCLLHFKSPNGKIFWLILLFLFCLLVYPQHLYQ